jgi:hypothetical protein
VDFLIKASVVLADASKDELLLTLAIPRQSTATLSPNRRSGESARVRRLKEKTSHGLIHRIQPSDT